MLRQAYKLVARMSPTLGHVIEGTYATVNGWRFDDLKRHIDTNLHHGGSGAASFVLARTFSELDAQDGRAADSHRIAFVTNLPPEDTGIATCSFYSWLGHDGAVDIFCPVTDPDWFMTNGLLLGNAGGVRLLDVEAFATACQVNRYRHIVIAIGNSDHCAYIQGVVKKLVTFGGLENCTLYVHDACLLNLIQKGSDISAHQMVRALETIYDRNLAEAAPPGARDWEVHAALAAQGVLGPRWFRSLGFRRFIVNSTAARDLLEEDLAGTGSVIQTLFHPAFLPLGADAVLDGAGARPSAGTSAPLTIGTFGIPSSAKRTEDIIEAARQLTHGGYETRLVMAGFGVNTYLERNARLLEGIDVRTFDGPSDVELLQGMSEVDVAVQLRRQNLGESSGVVPQLLELGRPVVVNAIGSFAEFGDAVVTVPAQTTPEHVAHAILRAAEDPPHPRAMRDYVDSHSPGRFRETLMSLLADGADQAALAPPLARAAQ